MHATPARFHVDQTAVTDSGGRASAVLGMIGHVPSQHRRQEADTRFLHTIAACCRTQPVLMLKPQDVFTYASRWASAAVTAGDERAASAFGSILV
jgi:hypothetical protein